MGIIERGGAWKISSQLGRTRFGRDGFGVEGTVVVDLIDGEGEAGRFCPLTGSKDAVAAFGMRDGFIELLNSALSGDESGVPLIGVERPDRDMGSLPLINLVTALATVDTVVVSSLIVLSSGLIKLVG